MYDFNASTFAEVRMENRETYIRAAVAAMSARFSNFVVTPEQMRAWEIGFSWIHKLALELPESAQTWICLPEYSAPLVSGRPDLVIVTVQHILVIEMKTGLKTPLVSGKKQTLDYSLTLWGKLKAARQRIVVPILLSQDGKGFNAQRCLPTMPRDRPLEVLDLNLFGLLELLEHVEKREQGNIVDFAIVKDELLYSPRPSVIEAATALVAATQDRNVITGLSTEIELDRISAVIQQLARRASLNAEKRIVVVAGPPGAGKTLVGLRLAHDPEIQMLLPESTGTPLYLTGNGPLVDVLVESLARDEMRRTGMTKPVAKSNADSKVRLIRGVTENRLGIESNVIIFDEGQRVWTVEHMRRKKGDLELGSEAEEVLSYLDSKDWALVVVLLGEGQEINTGEAGIITWLEAVKNRNERTCSEWKLTSPKLDRVLQEDFNPEIDESLRLKVSRRTDNAADVSSWVGELLDHNFSNAMKTRNEFLDFPIFVTRELDVAKEWLREQVRISGGTSGLLASSKSKRLFKYGLDVVADASRSFSWENWYLNSLPDLNSSEALEVAATEYKCQGLELDWVGVCWSWDLVLTGDAWLPRTLNSGTAKWRGTNAKALFQINSYRVLLTRSRRGMVIWVPRGFMHDGSMSVTEMDDVANALVKCGAVSM